MKSVVSPCSSLAAALIKVSCALLGRIQNHFLRGKFYENLGRLFSKISPSHVEGSQVKVKGLVCSCHEICRLQHGSSVPRALWKTACNAKKDGKAGWYVESVKGVWSYRLARLSWRLVHRVLLLLYYLLCVSWLCFRSTGEVEIKWWQTGPGTKGEQELKQASSTVVRLGCLHAFLVLCPQLGYLLVCSFVSQLSARVPIPIDAKL